MTCGPIPSLHPLYTEKDLVFDPPLVGRWIGADSDGHDTLTFWKSGEKSYRTIFSEKSTTIKYTVHLVRLGSFLFFDALPSDSPEGGFLPTHSFYRIQLEGDILSVAYLDEDWLKRMIGQGEVDIRHELVDNTIVLTASTRDLQEFIVKYADDAKAFPDPGRFRRLM
jgi:hypothetical protein